MAIRKTSLEKRVAARKRNAFEGIPNSAAKKIQKRNKAIADEGLDAFEANEYADELHEAETIKNDIADSGLL